MPDSFSASYASLRESPLPEAFAANAAFFPYETTDAAEPSKAVALETEPIKPKTETMLMNRLKIKNSKKP